MAKAKRITNRNLKATSSPDRKQATRQIILTIGDSNGDVFKIEELTKSGKRRELSDDEFEVLVGDEDAEDIGTVLEEAYSAGLTDALDHEHDEEKEEREIFRRLRRASGRQLLRRGLRGLLLRRILRREFQSRLQAKRAGNSTASH
jgi:hypothetical protein